DIMSWLKSNIIFSSLSDEGLKNFVDHIEIVEIETGDYLVHEGHVCEALFVVLKGNFRVMMKEGDKNIEVGELSEDRVIGDLSFFMDTRCSYTVVAIKKSSVVKISQE